VLVQRMVPFAAIIFTFPANCKHKSDAQRAFVVGVEAPRRVR
jgi:hypothetical protein